jgi:hypothetical protein
MFSLLALRQSTFHSNSVSSITYHSETALLLPNSERLGEQAYRHFCFVTSHSVNLVNPAIQAAPNFII